MFKVIVTNKVDSEVKIAPFEDMDGANLWIENRLSKNRPWGYYGPRTFPKKGLGYENEFDFNDALLIADSDYQYELTPEYDETMYEVDGEGEYVLDGEGNPIPTGEITNHPAVMQTWVNLHPEYEYTIEDITTEHNAQVEENALVASGQISTDKCNRVLNYISGYNISQEFTTEQINTMMTTFSAVNSYLKAGMPNSALTAVNASTPDGVVVTEALKTKIIAMLG